MAFTIDIVCTRHMFASCWSPYIYLVDIYLVDGDGWAYDEASRSPGVMRRMCLRARLSPERA